MFTSRQRPPPAIFPAFRPSPWILTRLWPGWKPLPWTIFCICIFCGSLARAQQKSWAIWPQRAVTPPMGALSAPCWRLFWRNVPCCFRPTARTAMFFLPRPQKIWPPAARQSACGRPTGRITGSQRHGARCFAPISATTARCPARKMLILPPCFLPMPLRNPPGIWPPARALCTAGASAFWQKSRPAGSVPPRRKHFCARWTPCWKRVWSAGRRCDTGVECGSACAQRISCTHPARHSQSLWARSFPGCRQSVIRHGNRGAGQRLRECGGGKTR